jgi:hypothetical protein
MLRAVTACPALLLIAHTRRAQGMHLLNHFSCTVETATSPHKTLIINMPLSWGRVQTLHRLYTIHDARPPTFQVTSPLPVICGAFCPGKNLLRGVCTTTTMFEAAEVHASRSR